MAKTNFLQIRLTPADRERLDRAARQRHLETATFARQLLLDALDLIERTDRSAVADRADPSGD